MEEPYDSPNIYTDYKMREQMKSQGVSVVLSGCGGDEVLAGYEYAYWPKASIDLRDNGLYWHAMRYEVNRKFGTLRRSKQTIHNGVNRTRHRFGRMQASALPLISAGSTIKIPLG